MALHRYTLQEGLNLELAQGGYDYVNAAFGAQSIASTSDYDYIAVTGMTEAEVQFTSADTDIWDEVTIIIPAGTTIYGRWSGVRVSSGDKAIVYRG